MYKQGYKEVALRVVYNKLTLLLLLGTSLFVNFYLLNQVTTISNNFEAFKNDPQAILQENLRQNTCSKNFAKTSKNIHKKY